jgi:glycosyltransferase involved in cell wall biosynthesis
VLETRIFINDTVHSRLEQRGITRYADKVIEVLAEAFADRVTVLSTANRNYAGARHLRPLHFAGRYRLNFILRDSLASMVAWSQRATIYFSPYFGRAATRGAEIYTVYDMIHELHPQYFDPANPFVRAFIAEKQRCIERATCLVAISERTALDILTCYPHIEAARIKVIPLGVDDFFRQGGGEPPNMRRPYFLYVGQRGLYKNFLRLVSAFALSGLSADHDLLAVSPSDARFSDAEARIIAGHGLQESISLVSGVTDVDLRNLYAGARALVYPSEYEGFGLPILEAMASGTLVLASCRASMPEVGGHAAYYFDPFDEEALADGLRTLAGLSEGERLARISEGKKRAQSFTWTKCQFGILDLFREMS